MWRSAQERNDVMKPCSIPRVLMVLAGLALLAATPLGAGEQLTIRVTPRVAFAPATLVVSAAAQRDPANRALQIQVDSSGYYRSSLMQLDGDQAAITTTVRYEAVPGGMYEVRATLFGSGGEKRAETTRTVQVISNSDRDR
jgi:hypothetical protein